MFKPGQLVSIVPLTNGDYQFSYIDESCGQITWPEEDYKKEDLPQLHIKIDLYGLKVVPYLDLIMHCQKHYIKPKYTVFRKEKLRII